MNKKATLTFLILFLWILTPKGYAITPPAIANLDGDAVSFTVAGAPVLLDAGSNANVTAGTANNFTDGLLTVSITNSTRFSEDEISIKTTGQITVNANLIYYAGTQIAAYSGGKTGRNLKIRFNSNATATAIDALLQSITYYNNYSYWPSTDPRIIQFILSDGNGGISSPANITVSFININHAPVANDEYYVLATDQAISQTAPGLKANDYDMDGDATTFSPVSLPLHGSLSLSNSGSFSYTPDAGYAGLDSFTYKLCDPSGACSGYAKTLFFIGSTNVTPNPANDNYTVNQDVALYVSKATGVLSNDNDPNSGSLRIFNRASLVTAPVHGILRLAVDGSFDYYPNKGFSGTDQFVYSNCDAQGACANATCTITINSVNTPPYAVDDVYTGDDNTPVTGNVLSNDTDYEGNALTASLISGGGPASGTVIFNADGSFTYTPYSQFGGIDKFQYQVCDNGIPSDCDTAEVIFVITSVNATPVITTTTQAAAQEDTPTAINSFYFSDTDAGSNAVTVILSVNSGVGTLSANPATGITIVPSANDSVIIKGSIADINTYISSDSVRFTGALNTYGNVLLTITINDGGFTGADPGTSGDAGSEESTKTISFNITSVNDAPVITVPAARTVALNTNLVISNEVSVSDVDAGSNSVQVTMTVNHGVISLPSTSGLVFLIGSGTADVTNTFSGTLTDINNALSTIIYTPTGNYTGTDILQITVSDLGSSGAGGAKTDTKTIDIAVGPLKPFIINVTSTNPNQVYKTGDLITVKVVFNEVVSVTGTPVLIMETGTVDQNAVYAVGTGTDTLQFTYSVQSGDLSADLDYTSMNALSGGTIKDNAGSKDALLDLPAPGATGSLSANKDLQIDGIAPVVTTVTLPADSTYKTGDELKFVVNFSEAITLTGATSYLPIQVGTNTVNATFLSSTSTSATYHYTILAGQQDTDGIGIGQLQLSTTTITDIAGNNAVLTFTPGNTTGILVDAIAPSVTNLTVTPGYYKEGTNIDLTVTWPESVFLTGTPRISLLIGSTTGYATYISGSGTNTLTFRYTVQAGDNDTDGIGIGTAIAMGTIEDAAGNAADLTINYTTTPGIVYVDTKAPAVVNVTGPADGTYKAGQILSFNVNVDETITVDPAGVTLPVTIGTMQVDATLVSTSATQLVFNYTVVNGDTDNDGIAVTGPLSIPAGKITDLAGNELLPALNNIASLNAVLVDASAPIVTAGQSFSLFENISSNTIIGTVVATDNSGTLKNWQITQNEDTDNDNVPAFAIDATTGQLTVYDADEFNFEKTAQFNIAVTVSDGYNTSAAGVVSIFLKDVNETPTVGVVADQTVCAGGEQVITVTGISAGPEIAQTNTLTVTSDNDVFTTLTVTDNGDGTATLRYELKADVTGNAIVTLTVKDNGGTANGGVDEISTQFTVNVSLPPVLSISSDQGNTVSKGATIYLTATGAATYTWEDADNILGGQNTATLNVRPQATATYTVNGVTAGGCTAQGSIVITVIDDYKLDATNLLTPNGDGINDKWVIRNIDSYPDNEVKIYDRTGRLIYHKKGYQNEWDATINGSPLAEGTYYYIVTFPSGQHTFKGFITIVRDQK
ncbi:tandem-95 repeat protein [[Flexibacter] sp. ATCC 35208]|uniref:tandem-95 repeat protein n=1 Tax=[Flexibacter] sp. ATCC 35208 TaxID=1936242 RepID=UPI0009C76E66|nr:tandem-95 repeat protein [[Flexibacter] sp. ATCC 35208]OMP79102.1 hypothetical protein BW716_10790 [[Flexibacter] sp. ATCC 35208]